MLKINEINFYLVSDSTGETALAVCNAVLAQFENINGHKVIWPMVRTEAQIDKIISDMQAIPGIILYTMVDEQLKAYMEKKSEKLGIPCISVLGHIVHEVGRYIGGLSNRNIPGWQHLELDDEYFKKIAAINFTISHDDGQNLNSLHEADIIIVGVSRTSKTPTSLCLAQRGLKTANVPFIPEIGLGFDIKLLTGVLVIALTISPDRLRVVRSNRLVMLGGESYDDGNYANSYAISEELKEARNYYQRNNIPIIDVTGKAIEETAAEIMNIFFEKIGKRS